MAWLSVISALYTGVAWEYELGPGLYEDDDVDVDVVVELTCTLILDSPGDITAAAVEDAEVEEGYIGNVAPAAV